jgi:hypothetical protein
MAQNHLNTGVVMKKFLLTTAMILASTSAFAAKGYQVTGPVSEVTANKIVIEKGKEKWELARDAASKIPADVKVGDKVTAYYSMTATEVESKGKAKEAKAEPVKVEKTAEKKSNVIEMKKDAKAASQIEPAAAAPSKKAM